MPIARDLVYPNSTTRQSKMVQVDIKCFANTHDGPQKVDFIIIGAITHQKGDGRPNEQTSNNEPFAVQTVCNNVREPDSLIRKSKEIQP